MTDTATEYTGPDFDPAASTEEIAAKLRWMLFRDPSRKIPAAITCEVTTAPGYPPVIRITARDVAGVFSSPEGFARMFGGDTTPEQVRTDLMVALSVYGNAYNKIRRALYSDDPMSAYKLDIQLTGTSEEDAAVRAIIGDAIASPTPITGRGDGETDVEWAARAVTIALAASGRRITPDYSHDPG